MRTDDYHPYVKLAWEAITEYVLDGRVKEAPSPLSSMFDRQAGVFVSIKKQGSLRGCIGTIESSRGNLAQEIIANAINAAAKDPRFDSIQPVELDQLELSVDVLGEAEEIGSIDELNPDKYGVIVEKDFRKGLLLPMLEGIESAEQQLEIAHRKAGIRPGEDVKLFRFLVERYN